MHSLTSLSACIYISSFSLASLIPSPSHFGVFIFWRSSCNLFIVHFILSFTVIFSLLPPEMCALLTLGRGRLVINVPETARRSWNRVSLHVCRSNIEIANRDGSDSVRENRTFILSKMLKRAEPRPSRSFEAHVTNGRAMLDHRGHCPRSAAAADVISWNRDASRSNFFSVNFDRTNEARWQRTPLMVIINIRHWLRRRNQHSPEGARLSAKRNDLVGVFSPSRALSPRVRARSPNQADKSIQSPSAAGNKRKKKM